MKLTADLRHCCWTTVTFPNRLSIHADRLGLTSSSNTSSILEDHAATVQYQPNIIRSVFVRLQTRTLKISIWPQRAAVGPLLDSPIWLFEPRQWGWFTVWNRLIQAKTATTCTGVLPPQTYFNNGEMSVSHSGPIQSLWADPNLNAVRGPVQQKVYYGYDGRALHRGVARARCATILMPRCYVKSAAPRKRTAVRAANTYFFAVHHLISF